MLELVTVLAAVCAAATLFVAVLILLALRRIGGAEPLGREQLAAALRAETEFVRRSADEQARSARSELALSLRDVREEVGNGLSRLGASIAATMADLGKQQSERLDGATGALQLFGERSERSHLALRETVDGRLAGAAAQQGQAAKTLREELAANVERLGHQIAGVLTEMGRHQKERLDNTSAALRDLTQKNALAQESLRQSVETRLDAIRTENTTKLDEMRRTVDERLQSTLEKRLGESFTRVVEQLNRVHEGLGEMKNLASNVGDLKSVLTNVKVRGTYGEVQLELILEQIMAPHQYVKDARVRPESRECVEFAVRLPGPAHGQEILLPIDSKFPLETFERLTQASEAGQAEAIPTLRKQLEAQIRICAKTICDKYVVPPATTDFAILFLPTEGLYAEALRQPGLIEALQREHKITVAGPTTLSALLMALQMGFRTLAIEKRSSEVWQILSAVKGEFEKYNSVVEGLSKQLNTAVKSVDKLGTRTRVMARTLRDVQELPDSVASTVMIDFEGAAEDDLPPEPLPPPRIVHSSKG